MKNIVLLVCLAMNCSSHVIGQAPFINSIEVASTNVIVKEMAFDAQGGFWLTNSPQNSNIIPNLFHFGADGQLISNDYLIYSENGSLNQVQIVKLASNSAGELAFIGSVDSNIRGGIIGKLNSQGNVAWVKQFKFPPFNPPLGFESHFMFEFLDINDDGLVIAQTRLPSNAQDDNLAQTLNFCLSFDGEVLWVKPIGNNVEQSKVAPAGCIAEGDSFYFLHRLRSAPDFNDLHYSPYVQKYTLNGELLWDVGMYSSTKETLKDFDLNSDGQLTILSNGDAGAPNYIHHVSDEGEWTNSRELNTSDLSVSFLPWEVEHYGNETWLRGEIFAGNSSFFTGFMNLGNFKNGVLYQSEHSPQTSSVFRISQSGRIVWGNRASSNSLMVGGAQLNELADICFNSTDISNFVLDHFTTPKVPLQTGTVAEYTITTGSLNFIAAEHSITPFCVVNTIPEPLLSANALRVWPNPLMGVDFTVEFAHAISASELTILDITGRAVGVFKLTRETRQNFKFPVDKNSGMYILRIPGYPDQRLIKF